MTTERLIYLPLGGAGEIGMNAYVYGYGAPGKERLILVDIGVAFPDMDSTPGVDLIFADISWLEERRDRLEAVFITHAHEDHVGAIGHLFERLGGPKVYARAFTANIARGKLAEYGIGDNAVTVANAWPDQIKAGPFNISFLPISHSIPESSALVIDSPEGRVIHTGDFKLDTDPVVGDPFDEDLWREVSAPGVRALVCDSTNVFTTYPGRSEVIVGPEITKLVNQSTGMFVATTFASNVSPEDATNIPRENLMLIVTGSQGERRAASASLSRGKHLGIELKEGDTFLFSSKTIPGNEKEVIRIINNFSEIGVDVVDDTSGLYHVSGHANGPDLERMHDIVNPQIVVPMHGEHRHLRQHTKLAEQKRRKGVLAVNGTMVSLSGNAPEVVDYVETGRTYLDGSVQVGALDGVIRDRIRMALNGHVTVTVVLDEQDEPLGDPWCDLMGLPELGRSHAPLRDVLEEDLGQFLNRAGPATLTDDDKIEESLRRIVRQSSQNEIGKKPEVTVVVSRLT